MDGKCNFAIGNLKCLVIYRLRIFWYMSTIISLGTPVDPVIGSQILEFPEAMYRIINLRISRLRNFEKGEAQSEGQS